MTCPRCGAEIGTDSAVCPACLLKLGLAGDEETALSPDQAERRDRDDGPRLTAGQQFGPYRIERLLGRGGMGEAYEAEHTGHGRRVAIKVLNQALADEKDRARFLREGQLAASISHPNTVYIFGAEEIEGTPVIVMELVAAGTLKDRVRRDGPMPPADAVDAILQIIGGLDAAHAGGILHRDIKPSNCFVNRDGTMKIGDFGLSISTMARDVTQLTTTGTFQGTPQFASPEQLKGSPLDVRSDIYSVGATLYYLLTGQAPFDSADLMALVSRIATEAPPSPRHLQARVPKALAQLVLTALAKDPAGRPASYQALADQLRPFGSLSRLGAPAPVGLRLVAAVADAFVFYFGFLGVGLGIAFGLAALLSLPTVPDPTVHLDPRWIIGGAFWLYFVLTEAFGGATIGKRLLRLRVVSVDQPRLAFSAVAIRSAVKIAALSLFIPVSALLESLITSEQQRSFVRDGLSIAAGYGAFGAVVAAVFATARRHTGYAAIHDRLSRTRVVLRPPSDGHRAPRTPSPADSWALADERIGPYRVAADPPAVLPEGFVAGYDEALQRHVWIARARADTPPVARIRRDLSRHTRMRWLGGARSHESWDAYEAIDGMPLLAMLDHAHTWPQVRDWLDDLAHELQAGLADGSVPDLSLDRVWIGGDRAARLCDWPAHSTVAAGVPPALAGAGVGPAEAVRFLHDVASIALDPTRVTPMRSLDAEPAARIPLEARRFLGSLRIGSPVSLEHAIARLTELREQPSTVSVRRRLVHLGACAAFPVLMGLFSLFMSFMLASRPEATSDPESAFLASRIRDTVALGALFFTMFVSLLSAGSVRGGLLLRALGIGIVNASGAEASRWRASYRALVAWSPVIALFLVRAVANIPVSDRLAFYWLAGGGLMALFVGGAIWAAWHPERGLQDRIVGTWLVPR